MKDETLSLRLPGALVEWIEATRGNMDQSAYIARLIADSAEKARRDAAAREEWLAEGRRQYTADVCRETLQIHDQLPIDEE